MLWVVGGVLILVWFILKFLLHHGGSVPLFLIAGISLFVVQFAAERRTRQQKPSSER